MQNEKSADSASFYKWIVGILTGAISFFLIKASDKLDNVEEMMQNLNKTSAVQEMRIQTNAEKIQEAKDQNASMLIRINKVEESVRQIEAKHP